jgi:wobble nucleotide-excising tRNase
MHELFQACRICFRLNARCCKDATPPEAAIQPIAFTAFSTLEKSAILGRKIVGRDDVVVAALIGRLGNSDWVKQGVGYLTAADGSCPFCQQGAPANLMEDLNAFFDEQYEADLTEIAQLSTRYEAATKAVCDRLDALVASPGRFIDPETLTERYHALKTAFELNHERLVAKRREPSSEITLEYTKEFPDAISDLLMQANTAIDGYNETIRDLSKSKRTLTSQVWRFIVEERRTDLTTYDASATKLGKMIEGLEAKIAEKKGERARLDAQLKAKEASITSVKPTVDEINRILLIRLHQLQAGRRWRARGHVPDRSSRRIRRREHVERRRAIVHHLPLLLSHAGRQHIRLRHHSR